MQTLSPGAVPLYPRDRMLRIKAEHLPPVAGIPVMDVLQVEMRPLDIRLTQEFASRYGAATASPRRAAGALGAPVRPPG